MSQTRRTGLRERKRLAAMRRAQQSALDLFDRYGYASVTIESIAEAAEISASSVYRYFGTKEQLVLWNEFGPVTLQRLQTELGNHPPLVALRRVAALILPEYLGDDPRLLRRRFHFIMEVPEVNAAFAVLTGSIAQLLARMLAERAEHDTPDFRSQVMASAMVGAISGALRHWYQTDFAASPSEVLDRALETIANLEWE